MYIKTEKQLLMKQANLLLPIAVMAAMCSCNTNPNLLSSSNEVVVVDSAQWRQDHKVNARIVQETKLFSVAENEYIVKADVWTGSKVRIYTLESMEARFCQPEDTAKTRMALLTEAEKIMNKAQKALDANPVYN